MIYAGIRSTYHPTHPPLQIYLFNSLARQAVFAWMVGIIDYCTLNLQYSVASAFTVAVGLYRLQESPRLMGRLKGLDRSRLLGKVLASDP